MQKILLFGLAFLIVVLCYLVAVLTFLVVFRSSPRSPVVSAPPMSQATIKPTFTLTPSPVPSQAESTTTPTLNAIPATPTPLPPTIPPTATPMPPTATLTPTPITPQVLAATTVNLRSGPGTNYPLVGTLTANSSATIIGRDAKGTWWQIQLADGKMAWVATSVVKATHIDQVPIVQAPPPPTPAQPPTATRPPVPPTPTRPLYQYEPTGWYGDKNLGLTRFLGTIKDGSGNPVNGVFVEAQCGSYRVISHGSGTTGWAPGFYDITLDRRPIVCKWLLTVVATDDEKTVKARLSETVEAETTMDKSIITANWRKNW